MPEKLGLQKKGLKTWQSDLLSLSLSLDVRDPRDGRCRDGLHCRSFPSVYDIEENYPGCHTCNEAPVHAWDEAWAFYAGSLEVGSFRDTLVNHDQIFSVTMMIMIISL